MTPKRHQFTHTSATSSLRSLHEKHGLVPKNCVTIWELLGKWPNSFSFSSVLSLARTLGITEFGKILAYDFAAIIQASHILTSGNGMG